MRVYETREEMALAAAAEAAAITREVLRRFEVANLLFATGTSQLDFLAALREQPQVDWSRVAGYHLDEYRGISADHPASFRRYLRTQVVEPLRPRAFHYLQGDAPDPVAECQRYAALIRENRIHLGFIGFGENGHIAFNDPGVADFHDPLWVKVADLDEVCRMQQVREGWFAQLDDVPSQALTLTVPAIMACQAIISVVPDERKAEAVRRALEGPVSPSCPASILRTHGNATLYLDRHSASRLTAW